MIVKGNELNKSENSEEEVNCLRIKEKSYQENSIC